MCVLFALYSRICCTVYSPRGSSSECLIFVFILQAAIVGYKTKKVLHIEVRNKYCAVCDRQGPNHEIPEHKCYKNWKGPSTAMEADGIVTGFKKSVELHGIK